MDNILLASHVVLWGFTVLLGVTLLAAMRQIGIIHTRIGPMGARMMNPGPEVGDEAPIWQGTDVAGRSLALRPALGKRTLVIFISLTCPHCEELMTHLRTWSRTERDSLQIVIACATADQEAVGSFIRKHRLQALHFLVSAELAGQYNVGLVPYAVLIDNEGIVRSKGLVNNATHLESLLNAEESGYASIDQWWESKHGGKDRVPVQSVN